MAAHSDAPVNPFDADGEFAQFLVLTNEAGQHSLWPSFADVPEDWTAVHGPCGRQEALDRITASAPELLAR
ncbi:MbtH family protein [Streptomyces sp. LP05-1]|uniref:MbtH family protein n=1 Tax=Streptomyces pyxinae TaxID=2970734 RepID=A0ABT2CJ83_9ACTN|nr:MbtH family protein [Streptomyces sp. LP05-1]MCS0637478.1 MbtH family protein [Streptomyces sp. LP05-1]